jgi:murein DD-endopeptidase MepM/ murein hydrolase activator NlpD
MRSGRWSYSRAGCALLAAIAVAWLVVGTRSSHAASTSHVQQDLGAAQNRVSSLAGEVGAASARLAQLNASITSTEQQIARTQADLDAKREQLLKLRSELNAARVRLAQLEAFQARAERVLSKQLVRDYEADQPDIISVVLEARGFKDLLERIDFARRVRAWNVQVTRRVRTARRAVAAQATRLGALEARQQQLTVEVLERRNSLASSRVSLVRQQLAAAQDRRAKANQLASARGQVADLQQQLSRLEAAQAAEAAQAGRASQGQSTPAAAASGSTGAAGSSGQASSGGGFTYPLPKGAASPPGTWSLDQGVDIAAPGNTPELAVCSGTIVLHGIGGFGPWAPVLHCDGSIGGYSYVYYGHAGPANQLPVGSRVSAGQVMSSIGPGIVGISSGPHLEIGFADASGSPIGTGSAPTMMSLLQGSYGG